MRSLTAFILAAFLTGWLFPLASAHGQIGTLEINIPKEHIGLGGKVRPGVWTPMLVNLNNRTNQAKSVICEWAMDDSDGDEVRYRRLLAANPGEQQVWLYGMPPVSTGGDVKWRVRVIEFDTKPEDLDSETGRAVDTKQVLSIDVVNDRPSPRLIGVLGSSDVSGFKEYREIDTQHEPCQLVYLDARTLPDRWHGLSSISALIWTPSPETGDPAIFTEHQRTAVRDWVARGGHLVVILSPDDQGTPWLGNPGQKNDTPMADMMPEIKATYVKETPYPSWLKGSKASEEINKLKTNVVRLDPNSDAVAANVSVLLSGESGMPLVVAGSYGFGRVTLIGIDVSSRKLNKLGLPDSVTGATAAAAGGDFSRHLVPNPIKERLWATVFAWRAPVIQKEMAEKLIQNDIISRATARSNVALDEFVAPMIAMPETATSALLLAILLFCVYWVVAGPVGFAVLRFRGMLRHSWLAFSAVVALFTVITWLGAWAMRPTHSRIEHFTVVDLEGPQNFQRLHAHSWMSLFVATHGRVNVKVESAAKTSGDSCQHLLSSPGIASGPNAEAATTYVNPQRYVVDCTNPATASFPMRSTAKQLEVDYLSAPGNPGKNSWSMYGQPTLQDNTVHAELTHNLPGKLTNVLVIYCPGNLAEPKVSYVNDWSPGTPLVIDTSAYQPLFAMTPNSLSRGDGYNWNYSYFQELLKNLSPTDPGFTQYGTSVTQTTTPDHARTTRQIEALTLFSTLPPPRYWDTRNNLTNNNPNFTRNLGRPLDLTHLLHLRRLIVIGHLVDGPCPVPLKIDGETIDSHGWTVVRWSCPVE